MIIYLELFAVLFIAVIPHFLYFLIPERQRKRRRVSIVTMLSSIFIYIGEILLILYIALQEKTGLLSIGFDLNKLELLWAGIFWATFFFILLLFVTKVIFKGKKSKAGKNFIKEVLLYKSMPQKVLLLISVSLAAISEEFLVMTHPMKGWLDG